MDKIERGARKFAGNWINKSDFAWHARSDFDFPELYGHYCLSHRDSGILDRSNHACMIQAMRESHGFREGETWRVESHYHWAVGHVNMLILQAIDENNEVTSEYETFHDMLMMLEGYPILNEDHYSAMEHEATISNLEQAISFHPLSGEYEYEDIDSPLVSEVYFWLAEHDPNALESHDDHGAWPSDDSIQAALESLGYITND